MKLYKMKKDTMRFLASLVRLVLAGPQAGKGDGDSLDVDTGGGHTVPNGGAPVGSEGVGKVVRQGGKGACGQGKDHTSAKRCKEWETCLIHRDCAILR